MSDAFTPRSTEKGFSRFLFDLADKKVMVRLHLQSGAIFDGRLVQHDGDTVVLVAATDRFNQDYIYLPERQVCAVAINSNESGAGA